MTLPRSIRLPDRFYLPRLDQNGQEVRDVMPWEGSVCYATDGTRVGVQYSDGSVTWLGEVPEMPVASEDWAADFAGVDLAGLVEGLREYVERHPILRTVWAEDLATLEALRRGPGGRTGGESAA
jgi:hypothetical protein